MLEFKIKKIKNLNDTKKIYNFMTNSLYYETCTHEEYFIPLHDLYELMIENLSKNKELQFYGTFDKYIMACTISTPLIYDTKTLSIDVIYVSSPYRRNGFAKMMLAEIEILARKMGYERIRTKFSPKLNLFFAKNGYELFLELAIPETLDIEDIMKINNLSLKYNRINKYNNINFVEFNVSEVDENILKYISKNTPLVKANYIYQKTFSKNLIK